MTHLLEQAALLALVNKSDHPWHTTAGLVEEAGSTIRLLEGDAPGLEGTGAAMAGALGRRVDEGEVDHYAQLIRGWAADGLRLVTVLDVDYPANLREVYNRPPFLCVRGELRDEDTRAIAVVGTRRPSTRGLVQARQFAAGLARDRVTVVSGMALGIDTAAHEAALDAGGRTLAVLGTGINRVYPPSNGSLAARILGQGAQVSQFWPDAPPTRASFPIRNVVTSGLALGTVVVEAHGKSGASMQARVCLEHGKRLFLVRSLVMQEAWAQRYAQRASATVVDAVEDVLEVVEELLDPPVQLSFS
jgi:DNA processing protein